MEIKSRFRHVYRALCRPERPRSAVSRCHDVTDHICRDRIGRTARRVRENRARKFCKAPTSIGYQMGVNCLSPGAPQPPCISSRLCALRKNVFGICLYNISACTALMPRTRGRACRQGVGVATREGSTRRTSRSPRCSRADATTWSIGVRRGAPTPRFALIMHSPPLSRPP